MEQLDPKAKNTKIDLRDDKMMGVMKDCICNNARHLYEEFIEYVQKGGAATKPYSGLLDFVETKTKDQKNALPPYRDGRIPSLFDINMEAMSVLQELALTYNLKVTMSTSLQKTKYIFTIWGKWKDDEERSKAGLDMVVKH